MLCAYAWTNIDPLQKLLYNFYVTIWSVLICIFVFELRLSFQSRLFLHMLPIMLFSALPVVLVATLLGTIELLSVIQATLLDVGFWLWCANLTFHGWGLFLVAISLSLAVIQTQCFLCLCCLCSSFCLLCHLDNIISCSRGLPHSRDHLLDTKQVTRAALELAKNMDKGNISALPSPALSTPNENTRLSLDPFHILLALMMFPVVSSHALLIFPNP